MSRHHATVSAAERPEFALRHAVMVYTSSMGLEAYATVHEVRGGQKPTLAAGVPATKDACARLARALGAAATLSGFVPPRLVYLGARSLIWWRPPAPATVFFDTTHGAAADQPNDKSGARLIGKRSGITPQPGLVFAVAGRRWYVYALRDAVRPGPDTALARAPYFNVWAEGQICTGNVRLPSSLAPDTLDDYERAFFGSEFTHPNVRGRERLVKAQGGAYAFWRDLLDHGTKAGDFPTRQLIDAKLTLKDLAEKLEKDKRDD